MYWQLYTYVKKTFHMQKTLKACPKEVKNTEKRLIDCIEIVWALYCIYLLDTANSGSSGLSVIKHYGAVSRAIPGFKAN